LSEPCQTIKAPEKNSAVESLSVPVSLLEKMAEAAWALEAFEDELEDYLLSQNAAFVARMRQARAHHVEGEARTLDALKHELCL